MRFAVLSLSIVFQSHTHSHTSPLRFRGGQYLQREKIDTLVQYPIDNLDMRPWLAPTAPGTTDLIDRAATAATAASTSAAPAAVGAAPASDLQPVLFAAPHEQPADVFAAVAAMSAAAEKADPLLYDLIGVSVRALSDSFDFFCLCSFISSVSYSSVSMI